MGENHSSLAMSNRQHDVLNGNLAYHHVRISLVLQKKVVILNHPFFHKNRH